MDRRGTQSDIRKDLLGVIAEDWVVLTVVCVLVNRGWRVEEVVNPGTGAWVEPGGVEDRGGEKPEVVRAEEESGTGLEEKPGIAEAEEEAPGPRVWELLDDIVAFGIPVLL